MPLSQNQRRPNSAVLHWSNHIEQTPDMLKRKNNLNTFKHNLTEHYLTELKNSISRYLFVLNTIVWNIPSF